MQLVPFQKSTEMPALHSTSLICLSAIAILMTAVWVVSLLRRDASIVDPVWGMAFAGTVWLAIWLNGQDAGPRAWLLAAMTTIWGLRLSLYLLWRNLGHGEDRRYRKMREKRGADFWWISFFSVFQLQAVLVWIVAFPLMATTTPAASVPFGWIDAAGTAIWCVGLFFETVGDWQLARFQSNPANAGRVMNRGLWRWTRHPNYFGDFCVWWGLYLVAAAGGAGWTVFSPLVMSFLLMRISGVTLLESTIGERRPEYAEYRRTTSPFFPWPARPAQNSASVGDTVSGSPAIPPVGQPGNPEPALETGRMQCMEIWGGNLAIDRSVSAPGLRIHVHSTPYRASQSGGGDLYYLTSCASGRITRFLLADVSGHGAAVSRIAVNLRQLLRKNVNRISQSAFVGQMNREFGLLGHESGFATAAVATFFEPKKTLAFHVAGHPSPFFYRASTQKWICLDAASRTKGPENLPLGVDGESSYPGRTVSTEPGDMFLLCSDAFVEAVDGQEECLGMDGLLRLLNQVDSSRPAAIIAALRNQITLLAPGNLLDDDATLILGEFTDSKASLRDSLVSPFRLLGSVTDNTRFRN